MIDYSAALRDALAVGVPLDTALATIRAQGASIIDSIKCVRNVKSVSLGEAKQIVSGSPVWDDVRDSHARFVDDLIHFFELNP